MSVKTILGNLLSVVEGLVHSVASDPVTKATQVGKIAQAADLLDSLGHGIAEHTDLFTGKDISTDITNAGQVAEATALTGLQAASLVGEAAKPETPALDVGALAAALAPALTQAIVAGLAAATQQPSPPPPAS